MRHRLLCSLAAIGLTYAGAAAADPPKIKGTYAAVGNLACLVAPGSVPGSNPTPGVPLSNSGFTGNLVPNNPDSSFYSTSNLEGIFIFDGKGNGSRSGTNVGVTPRPTPGPSSTYPAFNPSAGSDSFAGTFTYTVNSDGTFTFQSTDTTGTALTGGRTGQTYSVNLIQGTGLIGKDAHSLTLATTTPIVEIITYSNGDAWPRICYRQRVLVKISD